MSKDRKPQQQLTGSNQEISASTHAFTLAETLITLMVIGILAMTVIPALINNAQDITFRERNKNVLYKLSQAVDKMKVLGLLETRYASTSDFVDELQKHLKITKRCSSSNLTECFSTNNFTNVYGQAIYASDLETSEGLGRKSWNSETEGIILADGIPLLITYNVDRCKPVGQFDAYSTTANFNSSNLSCLSLVYDLNSSSGPNLINKDVRTLNNALDLYKVDNLYVGSAFAPSPVSYAECVANKSLYGLTKNCCTQESCGDSNYLVGAIKECYDKGMHLPTQDELLQVASKIYGTTISAAQNDLTIEDQELYNRINKGGYKWTSTPYATGNNGQVYNILPTRCTMTYKYAYTPDIKAFCIAN